MQVMASSKRIPCGPCQGRKFKNKAEKWCYNCDEGLFSTCSGLHKISKFGDHKTMDITIYKPSIHAIRSECDKHGQQFTLYCPSHLMPCCDECISKSHSNCTGIKSLAGVVEKTKIDTKKESLDKDINSVVHILNEMVSNKTENIKRGEQQYESIKETVAKFRKKINKHLDHLEKKLYQEIATILDEEKSLASNLITDIEEKKSNLNAMKDQLHAATTQSLKLQLFLEVHQIEQQVHQYQRYVEDLDDDERAKIMEIKLEQNDEIDKTISKLESLKSFGEVFVDKTKMAVNRERRVRSEAQVESREHCKKNNMTMNIEKTIEIPIDREITDMICLMDGKLIIVDGHCQVLTPDGKLQKQLPIPGEACCVTQINKNTIAISYPFEKVIKIFNMENETVIKVISLDKGCWGLSFANNSLAVACVSLNNNEIRIIDLEGNTVKSIPVHNEVDSDFLVHCNDRVIYIDYKDNAVYSVEESGVQIWRYPQHLSSENGLCTDSYGNIFVIVSGSNRITVISKDGNDSKVLTRREDGLMNCHCICFKQNESSGFICDYGGNYLTKFSLSFR